MTKRRQSISMAVLRSPEQETLLDEGYYLHSVLPPSHIGSIPVGVFIYDLTHADKIQPDQPTDPDTKIKQDMARFQARSPEDCVCYMKEWGQYGCPQHPMRW